MKILTGVSLKLRKPLVGTGPFIFNGRNCIESQCFAVQTGH